MTAYSQQLLCIKTLILATFFILFYLNNSRLFAFKKRHFKLFFLVWFGPLALSSCLSFLFVVLFPNLKKGLSRLHGGVGNWIPLKLLNN